MSQFKLAKPLALIAVLASSVTGAVVSGGTAQATSNGEAASPVTVTTSDGVVHVVGGNTIALPAGAHDVSWAGQGGRIAYIAQNGDVYTADFDGTHRILIAAGNGTARSHTVWDLSSGYVIWSEGPAGSAKLLMALASGSRPDLAPQPYLGAAALTAAGLGSLGQSAADIAGDMGSSVVFQTTNAGGATGIAFGTWTNQTETFTQVVAPGDATHGGQTPTISPDGTKIVFVRADANGDKQLWLTTRTKSAWSAPKQVTWMTGDHTSPIYEVDGKTVAFEFANRVTPAGSDPNGTYQVDADAAAAAGPASQLEKPVSALVGGLAVRTDLAARVTRFAGTDRFGTAIQASQYLWRSDGAPATDLRAQAGAVVLSRSDVPADALGGAALAAHKNAPLLLTDSAGLTPSTRAEIQRILPAGSTVYLLGGTGAIAPAVADTVAALGYKVVRIGGADRFATAVDIANAVDPNATDILVATGVSYPDALSAGAAAATLKNTVVVLTDNGTMPASTEAYLEGKANSNTLRYLAAIGGAADHALTAATWKGYAALVGTDRFQTSYLVAHELFGYFTSVGVATGYNWPDSLSGGAFMGEMTGPLILVDPTVGLTDQDNALIDAERGSANWGYVFGGTSALPTSVDRQLAADVATSTGSIAKAGPAAANLSTPNVTRG